MQNKDLAVCGQNGLQLQAFWNLKNYISYAQGDDVMCVPANMQGASPGTSASLSGREASQGDIRYWWTPFV